jgi:hypothetical protein
VQRGGASQLQRLRAASPHRADAARRARDQECPNLSPRPSGPRPSRQRDLGPRPEILCASLDPAALVEGDSENGPGVMAESVPPGLCHRNRVNTLPRVVQPDQASLCQAQAQPPQDLRTSYQNPSLPGLDSRVRALVLSGRLGSRAVPPLDVGVCWVWMPAAFDCAAWFRKGRRYGGGPLANAASAAT